MTAPLHIAVTGANGFIGRHLVARLQRDGHTVSAVQRHDLRLPQPCDVVVHLAAYIPPNMEDAQYAESCLQGNALLTLRVVQAARERGARLVFASSGQGYRPAPGLAVETDALDSSWRATYYLASKQLAETYVEHLARGLSAITLRLANVYGPGMRDSHVVARFMANAQRGLLLEVRDGGDTEYDWVFVGDVVEAMAMAVSTGQPGVYNIGGGAPHSLLELAQSVCRLFPAPPEIRIEPAAASALPAFRCLSIEKARAAWGYSPVSLNEGLLLTRDA